MRLLMALFDFNDMIRTWNIISIKRYLDIKNCFLHLFLEWEQNSFYDITHTYFKFKDKKQSNIFPFT